MAAESSVKKIDLNAVKQFVPQALQEFFDEHKRVALAYSGGCDSVFLLACALACGAEVHPFTVNTAFQYGFEADDARKAAEELGLGWQLIEQWTSNPKVVAGMDADVSAEGDLSGSQRNNPQVLLLELDIFEHPEVIANPPDRCYHCKKVIFGTILEEAKKLGVDTLIDGTNASDDPSRRPGFRALKELNVLSPLRMANLTKDDIRALSRKMGLLTADKPNYSCLATKVEPGEKITAERLSSFVQEDWRDR